MLLPEIQSRTPLTQRLQLPVPGGLDLLVEAQNIGERRGFYTALVQMNEGTSVIVQHLNHPQWYVVRNAADLCGELALSGIGRAEVCRSVLRRARWSYDARRDVRRRCERRESNPDPLRDRILSPARLPVPPLRPADGS